MRINEFNNLNYGYQTSEQLIKPLPLIQNTTKVKFKNT